MAPGGRRRAARTAGAAQRALRIGERRAALVNAAAGVEAKEQSHAGQSSGGMRRSLRPFLRLALRARVMARAGGPGPGGRAPALVLPPPGGAAIRLPTRRRVAGSVTPLDKPQQVALPDGPRRVTLPVQRSRLRTSHELPASARRPRLLPPRHRAADEATMCLR
jgi:hypothetical protein